MNGNSKEKLAALRIEIDDLDRQLIGLFKQRMEVSESIARAKTEGNMSVVDLAREQKVIETAIARTNGQRPAETIAFMQMMMSLSKIRQNEYMHLSDPADIPAPEQWKRENVRVGFQGVPGAWGEHGAQQLFPEAERVQHDYFEDVFMAVSEGAVDYGVVPIANSQTGAIGEVYDLLRKHNCYIVGEIWIAVAQCLLGVPHGKLADIREVYSHPEGFNQCRRFLKDRSWDLTACRNTAYAAKMVSEKGEAKYAAIGSRRAAQLHGLSILAPDIMDNPHNRTRFIAISAVPVYDDGSKTTAVTFSTAHQSGALCSVLQTFMLAGINLTRIESRPVTSDRYRFFVDLEANINSDTTQRALREASVMCEYFEILGCYATAEEHTL